MATLWLDVMQDCELSFYKAPLYCTIDSTILDVTYEELESVPQKSSRKIVRYCHVIGIHHTNQQTIGHHTYEKMSYSLFHAYESYCQQFIEYMNHSF